MAWALRELRSTRLSFRRVLILAAFTLVVVVVVVLLVASGVKPIF